MLQIQNLHKVYPGPVSALQGLELDVAPGLFGLLGPNGSGKTTLMRILAGLLQPTDGRVCWQEREITDSRPADRPRLGYLPQDVGFYPELSGERMLDHLLVLKGVHAPGGRARLVAELLERVNLTSAARQPVRGYSGGMKRRLGIAQAIAGEPDLLIVDEPTTGLDPEERLRFHRLMADMGRNRVVIVSTHLVEEVATFCPRFAVLLDGCLLADTTPGAARAALEGCMVAGEVGPQTLATLEAEGRLLHTSLVEGRTRIRLHWTGGAPPAGLEPVEPTLEDAYLVLTRAARLAHAQA